MTLSDDTVSPSVPDLVRPEATAIQPLVHMSAASVPTDNGATLTVRIKNESDRDVAYKKNGYVQRRDGDTWVNIMLAPFGRADQPGRPCTTDVACDVTPDAPLLRAGETRSYVIALPELDPGEYRLSMRPTYLIDSNTWTV